MKCRTTSIWCHICISRDISKLRFTQSLCQVCGHTLWSKRIRVGANDFFYLEISELFYQQTIQLTRLDSFWPLFTNIHQVNTIETIGRKNNVISSIEKKAKKIDKISLTINIINSGSQFYCKWCILQYLYLQMNAFVELVEVSCSFYSNI